MSLRKWQKGRERKHWQRKEVEGVRKRINCYIMPDNGENIMNEKKTENGMIAYVIVSVRQNTTSK